MDIQYYKPFKKKFVVPSIVLPSLRYNKRQLPAPFVGGASDFDLHILPVFPEDPPRGGAFCGGGGSRSPPPPLPASLTCYKENATGNREGVSHVFGVVEAWKTVLLRVVNISTSSPSTTV